MPGFKAGLRANVAMCALGGVLAGLWFPPPLPTSFIAAAAPLLLVLVWWLAGLRPAVGCVATLAAWLNATDYQLSALAEADSGERLLRGCVASIPRTVPDGFSFRFRQERSGALIQLRTYDPDYKLAAGECHVLLARLKPPHGQLNAGQFDRALWLMRERVTATGYVPASSLNRRVPDGEGALRQLQFRARLAAAIGSRLGDSPVRGIVQGLVLGVREEIGDDQWIIFRRTGTVHLMAISGLHVSLVAAAAWVCARWLPLPVGSPFARGRCAAVVAAVAYAMLAGWTVPASRAALMLVIIATLAAGRRHAAALAGLWFALCIALLADPFRVFGSGFWMSYLAVALLLTAPTLVQRRYGALPFAWHRVRQLVGAQWRLTIGLALPSLLLFGGLAPLAPVINLVAIPAFTLLLPVLLVSTGVVLVMPVAQEFYLLVATVLEYGVQLLQAAADSTAGILRAPSGAAAMALLAVGCMLQLQRCRARRIAGIVLLAGAWLLPDPAAAPPLRVDVLDVGQGTAVVLRTPGRAMLFDTGPGWRGGNAGVAVVIPFLRSQRVRRLDFIIVSHADNDHSGGLEDIRAAYPEAVVISSRPETAGELACRHGMAWRAGEVEFRFLHPHRTAGWSDNDASCVLLIRVANEQLLFPGDIERHAEAVLVARDAKLDAALVLAPHHGSATSSSAPLVEATNPDYLVYTTGYRNRWGFPAESVVEAWSGHAGCQLNTARSGALSFIWSPTNGLRLDSARATRWSRPWALRAHPDELCLDD